MAFEVTRYWLGGASLYHSSALYLYILTVRVTSKETMYGPESEGWFLRLSLSGGRKQRVLTGILGGIFDHS